MCVSWCSMSSNHEASTASVLCSGSSPIPGTLAQRACHLARLGQGCFWLPGNQEGNELKWHSKVLQKFRIRATSMHMAYTLYMLITSVLPSQLESPWQRYTTLHCRTVFHGERMFLRRNLKQIQSLRQLVEQPWWWLPWPWWCGCTRAVGAREDDKRIETCSFWKML